jgi:hypothetical protein
MMKSNAMLMCFFFCILFLKSLMKSTECCTSMKGLGACTEALAGVDLPGPWIKTRSAKDLKQNDIILNDEIIIYFSP